MRSHLQQIDLQRLLTLVPQPMLALSPSGTVRYANQAAHKLFGSSILGTDLLSNLPADGQQRFLSYLSRCTGASAPTVGAFTFLNAARESARYRAYGSRLSSAGQDGEICVGLRLQSMQDNQFSVLAGSIKALNTQIRQRLVAQSELEVIAGEREVLLRELHHRVKNNLQMLMSMFSGADREAQTQELADFVGKARGRLIAMSAAHDSMYGAQRLRTARSADLIRQIGTSIVESLCPAADLEWAIDDHPISSDRTLPLALILNELLTNASKYGLRNGRGRIRVEFRRRDEVFYLVVKDDGPGFAELPAGRSRSGLGLVNALARQLKGELLLENEEGAMCTIQFQVAER